MSHGIITEKVAFVVTKRNSTRMCNDNAKFATYCYTSRMVTRNFRCLAKMWCAQSTWSTHDSAANLLFLMLKIWVYPKYPVDIYCAE